VSDRVGIYAAAHQMVLKLSTRAPGRRSDRELL